MWAHRRRYLMVEKRISVCPHDCPDTCSVVVTVEDGKVTKLEGDPNHPFTRGFLCGKVARYEERVYSPYRLPHRLKVSAQTYADGFPTPSGKLEFYSESMKQAGFDPLPCYQPCCSEEERKTQGDLHLIAPPSKHFLNSTFGSVPSLVVRAGRPTLLIHPEEARKRAIGDGQVVKVHNGLGECRLYAVITGDVPTGVVVAASVWWTKHSPEGKGINQLTSPKTTDMAGGSTFHCNRVFVTPD